MAFCVSAHFGSSSVAHLGLACSQQILVKFFNLAIAKLVFWKAAVIGGVWWLRGRTETGQK